MSSAFVKVGKVSDIPSGGMLTVLVGEESVLVANVAGKLYAIGDTCTHRGCSLGEGVLEGGVVTCPCHGGRFDVTTGEVKGPPPSAPEPVYEVKVEGSEILVKKR